MSGERVTTITGSQGAMIYLAESLSDVKNEQRQTNALLRELIDLVRTPPQASSATQPDDERDAEEILREMRAFEARAQANHSAPNGAPNGATHGT